MPASKLKLTGWVEDDTSKAGPLSNWSLATNELPTGHRPLPAAYCFFFAAALT